MGNSISRKLPKHYTTETGVTSGMHTLAFGIQNIISTKYLGCELSRQRSIASRLLRRHSPCGAFPLSAFRAAQSFGNVAESSIPSTQTAKYLRSRNSFISTSRTGQNQRVLPKLITQFLDMERWHAANCSSANRWCPSSIETVETLYIGHWHPYGYSSPAFTLSASAH